MTPTQLFRVATAAVLANDGLNQTTGRGARTPAANETLEFAILIIAKPAAWVTPFFEPPIETSELRAMRSAAVPFADAQPTVLATDS